MSKVSTSWDPVSGSVPDPSKFTSANEHPGLSPHMKSIADTPGEKATNDTGGLSYNKTQPFGKGGSGYTKSS